MGQWIKALALTPERMEQIEELLNEGMYEKHVYGILGIAEATWYKWKRDARELEDKLTKDELTEDDLEEDDIKLLQFLMITKKGRSVAIRTNLQNIQKAGLDPSHWQASAWYLERVANAEFGRSQTIKHEGAIGTFDVELTPEEEEKFKENLNSIFPDVEVPDDNNGET